MPRNLFRVWSGWGLGFLEGIMKKIDWGILEKLAILVVIISGIIASIYYLWGGLKMVWSFFTIQINSFWLIIAIWFFIPVLMGINRWNRKKKEEGLIALKSKHDEETKQLKAEIAEETKQYDALVKKSPSELEEKTEQYDALVKNQKSQLEKKVHLIDCEITGEEYLFSWGNVPGNDSDKLLKFLSDNLDMGWAENAEVLKLDDRKTIRVCKDENSAEVIIDAKKEKATLKSSDGSMYDLKLKKECGKLNIYRDGSIDNPKIIMIQRFANMSELQLKLSKVELRMKDKDGDIEIDTFIYDPPSHTMDFGSKIEASEDGVFSPLNLNCWIKCETTKLRRVIPDYQGKDIEIIVKGKIQFVVGTTKIDKVIEVEESITFKSEPKRSVIVS